ncbi:Alpha/Beta hydrolase protein [Trichophaea hybrida]|nr:Alpha/Beta hydrolase protein [Trichophaea hybrida]
MSVPSPAYTNWLSLLNPSAPRRTRPEILSHLAALNNAQAPELSLNTLDVQDLFLPSGLKLRVYNSSSSSSATILHIHGGGWDTGDLDTEDLFCCRLCSAGCTVYALSYTPATYPTPLTNLQTAISHLLTTHTSLILSGTANGASMVLSHLQRHGAAGVAGVILLTPWCVHPDFGVQVPVMDPLGVMDVTAGYGYYGGGAEEVSPLLGEVGMGWPKILVVLCTVDECFWEGERLVEKVRACGGRWRLW